MPLDDDAGSDASGPRPTVRFQADRGDARLRLDQVLLRHVRDVSRLSRAQVQRWIASGAVSVDGRLSRRPSARVREGADVALAVPAGAPRRVRPSAEPHPLEILYEDAALVAIDKPAGLVVHPTYRQHTGTLLNAVLWRVRERHDVRPGILTRLDKDTSGVVIVALDATVHAALQRDAAQGRLRKEYLAIVRGIPRPRHGRIAQPLGRDPHDRRRVIVTTNGTTSETRYEVLATRHEDHGTGVTGWISLVRCELVTGRTHQIRVHLASCGWPILGDGTYGVADRRLTRQALHAWRVTLPHPQSRETLTITAPLPADLRALALTPPAPGTALQPGR